MLLTSNPTPQDYGALGNGVHDDTSAINAALAAAFAAGGGIVDLPWGNYLISSPVNIPPYVTLQGEVSVSLPLIVSGAFPNVSRLIMSASWAPGSAAGIVQFQSQTPGGWSVPASASGLRSVAIDGSLNASTNANGILFTGPVYDTHLTDVFIYKPGHNGIASTTATESGITPTSAYHLRFQRVTVDAAVFRGWGMVNPTDSTVIDCLMFGCGDNGWEVSGTTGNVLFVACRAEWNTGYGFHVTGTQTQMTFTGCETDNNTKAGVFFDTVTASADGCGISWTGGKVHDDGKNGTDAGVSVSGCTVPVAISGTSIGTGNAASSYFPVTGLTVASSIGLTVSGCSIWGHTTSWSDGGGNTSTTRKGCLGITGDPGSQTRTPLQDLPFGVPQIQSSATTVTGTTAETVLQTYTVPANEPVAGSVYHITGYGVFTIASGNLTWTVRWGGTGGTSIAAFPSNTAPALTNGSFWYDVMLTFRSSTSVTAALNLEINSSTITDASTSYVSTPSSATTVVTSSATALTVDVTPSVSGDSITLMGGCTRKLA